MRRILIGLGLLSVLALVVFGALPGTSRFVRLLQDSAHAPAFACVACLLLLLLRGRQQPKDSSWRSYVLAGLASLGLGIAIEFVQRFIGRDASLVDVIRDAAGVSAGLAFAIVFNRDGERNTQKWCALVGAAICLLLILPFAWCGFGYWQRANQFPVLYDSQQAASEYFIQAGGADMAHSASGLELRFGSRPWPGVSFDEPIADWHAYRELLVDVANPTLQAIAITVRAHDREHDFSYGDRFNREFVLPPNTRETLRVALTDIAQAPVSRAMNLASMADLTVFRSDGIAGGRVLLHRIWLQ